MLHPPVAHGDLLRLDLDRGDVVVIVDGYYHQRASVRHKEILALLADGVMVVGCASMGALRAAELAEYGMVGYGTVYRMYRDGVLDADDEVAVAHTPAPDYHSFTVPTVVVRHATGLAVRAGVLNEIEAASIVAVARDLHYTERSWQAMERAVAANDSAANALGRLRKFVDSNAEATDIKVIDVLDTLRKLADGELRTDRDRVESWASSDWHNRFLGEWQAEFRVSMVDEIEVSHSAIVRYQQLYREDFPACWERFVLRDVAGADNADRDLVALALAAAARNGLEAGSMSDAHRERWLTAREAAELTPDEALLRILVRAHRPLSPTRELIDDQPDLVEHETARRMVAEATVVNAEVATWSGKQTVDHLKLAALHAHLAQVWRIDDADPKGLLAAALDRGFSSVHDAVEAARMFFLHKSFIGVAG